MKYRQLGYQYMPKLETALADAIENFVTVNRLMQHPAKITHENTVFLNDDLQISWMYITLTDIYPTVRKIRKKLEVSMSDLGDLGLGKLGIAVLDLVRALADYDDDMRRKIFQGEPIDRERSEWGFYAWLDHLVDIVVKHGIAIYNAYLDYLIDSKYLIHCAEQDCLVYRDDMQEMCAFIEYKHHGCDGCMMQEPEISRGWLRITLPKTCS